ncbi:hypothetical protein H920_09352 [Fukomys damarensis]|uniref:Uncharacterized protein n=1 Tax=Fukomys damarensis TaxID=885580 RepID=A0A091DAU2_FUKDA|nr:hypothetical protein H920_09352 [Fukomys damarensis]
MVAAGAPSMGSRWIASAESWRAAAGAWKTLGPWANLPLKFLRQSRIFNGYRSFEYVVGPIARILITGREKPALF